jgi:hypothetical protein
MFCAYCGSQNSEGRKFCGNCGKQLVRIETQNAVNSNSPGSSQSQFCAYCGSQNSEGRKYCGNCGEPLAPVQTQKAVNPYQPVPAQPSHPYLPTQALHVDSGQKTKTGPKWAAMGAALAVLGFFLPWAVISYGFSLTISGWQMSTGNYGKGYLSQVQALPAIFLILLLGLVGFVCLNGKRSGAIIAMACGVTGMIGMIIVAANLFAYTPAQVAVTLGGGYFGEWLGFLIMAGVGFFALRQMSTKINPVTTPSLQGYPSSPIASTLSVSPPLLNLVPPANPNGLGSNVVDPNSATSVTPTGNPPPKKNTWKEIG